MEIGILIATGVSFGLLVIYRSFVGAEEDPETFDATVLAEKFKKPANWKVGKLPDSTHVEEEKKNRLSLALAD
ncbi:hypothetical protein ADIS_2976 [Lunatimonas lonarensis]|uniref:Uncharacterized protein n=1 Tax=Lunatimonas lonarensis TaxID=1232681 RepID=R7ZQY0_9BACT|nr:hypothetical protein [Lunatimonas lonarensis]EON76526.1 hypothetical protein ADIS_2976 [Lunatimonas lonarensis]